MAVPRPSQFDLGPAARGVARSRRVCLGLGLGLGIGLGLGLGLGIGLGLGLRLGLGLGLGSGPCTCFRASDPAAASSAFASRSLAAAW
eukprot:scaffold31067_cov33-Phaeocystis_antarctica.AAC.2